MKNSFPAIGFFQRILDTTDESDSDTAKNNSHVDKVQALKYYVCIQLKDFLFQKPKLQSTKNTMQQAIKKKLFSQNKIQIKKKRLIDPLKKTVKELLREKREDLDMSMPLELEKEGK